MMTTIWTRLKLSRDIEERTHEEAWRRGSNPWVRPAAASRWGGCCHRFSLLLFAVVLHLTMRKVTRLVRTALVSGRVAVDDELAAIGVWPQGRWGVLG
jgi:hypothetical protein